MKKDFSKIKFFLITFSILVTLLVLIFISPLLVNLNTLKSSIELELNSAFSTSSSIEGNIVYSLKTGPKINIENVVFSKNNDEGMDGNINQIQISVSPFDIFQKKVNFMNIRITDGSLSVPEEVAKLLTTKNTSGFKKLNIENVSIKILNKQSEIQIDNNEGTILYKDEQVSYANISGIIGNLNYNVNLDSSKFNFSIPKKNFNVEYLFNKDKNFPSFVQIKSASNLLFPGLKNIYLRSDISANKEKIVLENIKLTSSTYNGVGRIEIELQPRIFVKTDMSFGRTNFTNISSLELASFINDDLFELSSQFNGSFNLQFKHIIMDQNYFDDLNLDVNFESGDVVLNNIEFISEDNNLQLSGRIFQESNDKLMFFKTKFRTSQLKKLCIQACKSKAETNQYSMVSQGTLDIKKSKIYLDEFFSNKKHDAAEISNLNLNLNSMLAGNLKKTFSLKNFLSIY